MKSCLISVQTATCLDVTTNGILTNEYIEINFCESVSELAVENIAIYGMIIYAYFCGLKTQAKRAVMSNSIDTIEIFRTPP